VDTVLENLRRNADMAKKIVAAVVPQIPKEPNWPCHSALHNSIMTDKKFWPAKTKKELAPLLAKYL
jgi:5'-methylthioadenosine phosphorylase